MGMGSLNGFSANGERGTDGMGFIRATGKNVIVQQLTTGKETSSGIIIPEESIHQATVKAIGPECPDEIRVEDRVVFNLYSGTKVTSGDEEFLILKYDDIVARVVDE